MSEQESEYQKIPEKRAITNPMELLGLAVSSNADVDRLEKLMNLQERWEKRQAEKAYIEAMAKFQSECPTIIKSKEGGKVKATGKAAYKYAPIDRILETKDENGKKVKELIAECGFSYDLNTPEVSDKGVKAVLTISHILGHSKTFELFMPYAEQTNIMNQSQVVGATTSYAKRYAFLDGFGIMTGDEDTDSITDGMMDKYKKIVENWQYVEEYVDNIVSQIKSKETFENYINNLPSESQTNQFIELLKSVPEENHKKFWIFFQKQTKETADKFIQDIKLNLTKNKEQK